VEVRQSASKSKYLLLLTATPAQNDLDELYNLIRFCDPASCGAPPSSAASSWSAMIRADPATGPSFASCSWT